MTTCVDLRTYLQNKNIRDNMIIPKQETSPKEEVRNATDLKYFLKDLSKENTNISLQIVNKLFPIVFIYQDIAYFSRELNPELMKAKPFTVLLKTYSKDRLDL